MDLAHRTFGERYRLDLAHQRGCGSIVHHDEAAELQTTPERPDEVAAVAARAVREWKDRELLDDATTFLEHVNERLGHAAEYRSRAHALVDHENPTAYDFPMSNEIGSVREMLAIMDRGTNEKSRSAQRAFIDLLHDDLVYRNLPQRPRTGRPTSSRSSPNSAV